MADACLELFGFGFAFGEKTVVRSIDLAVPRCGLLTLSGPVAAGKSSLARWLAGELPASGPCQSWGRATHRGAPPGERGRPALAGQRARWMIGSVLAALTDGLEKRERLTRAEQRDVVEAMLQSLGLGQQMDFLRRFSLAQRGSVRGPEAHRSPLDR